MSSACPTGAVTFLFTDIEGSTARWETQTDTMRAVLALHDEALRTAIEGHGGWIFKHTGDGVLSAFASPKEAVLAAIEAQRTLEVEVRMGLATGEAELRDHDYFGPTLNRAARVMAAGHGGQVLLANSTAGLVSGIDLLDLGEHRLRGLPGAHRIFQVRAEGLRPQFPALRTLDPTPGNLRPQATSFIGREAEVEELVVAVAAHRLVTLTGVGGVGKTRLALQVAANVAPDFPEGVFLLELATVGDPAAVPDAVATALDIRQQPGMALTESIAEGLAGRHRLLVFDNCEHVLDAAADLVDAILARSTTVKVVATSREGLRLPAEHLWPVPSLPIRSAGVALFVERAQAVSPHFTLGTESDTEAVFEICRRLDGIPLAIELAAARMVSLRPSEVCERLGERFRLLTGGRRALERHQTLLHTVKWSYDLLEPNERMLLDRCSVFAGGFDLEAAIGVGGAGELDELAVLDLLDALVRKSLLLAQQSDGTTRFVMLETIRQFAEDRLAETGTSDQIRDRHSRFFAAREDAVLSLWNSPRQRQANDWLWREIPNLRAAFRWAADRSDIDSAAAIAIYGSLMAAFGGSHEPIAWAEELLDAARRTEHRRLAALYLMASLCGWTDARVNAAVEYAQSALRLLQGPGYEPAPFGYSYFWLAFALFNTSPDRALELYETEVRTSGDRLGWARLQIPLALHALGRRTEAMSSASATFAGIDPAGNPTTSMGILLNYGIICGVTRPLEAMTALRRALTIASATGSRFYEIHVSVFLGMLEAAHGDPREALDLLEVAIDHLHGSGDTHGLRQWCFAGLAVTLARLGRFEPAATLRDACGEWPLLLQSYGRQVDEVLGDDPRARLPRAEAAMERGDAVRYAFVQLRLAREALEEKA